MSLDVELILQALSSRFEAFEAKWETRFAAEGAASPAAPPDRADAELEVPLAARMTSTAMGAAEIVASAESLAVSRPQQGGTALLESQSTTTPATTTHTAPSPLDMVPTTAGMAEIPDIEPTDEIRTSVVNIEPTDEIRNDFVDIKPTDEIRSDGCLATAVVAHTKSTTVFPIVTSTNPEFAPQIRLHIPRGGALHSLEFGIPAATCSAATFNTKLVSPATSSSASSTPITCWTVQPWAPSCSSALVARVAEEKTCIVSLTMCSTDCSSHNNNMLKPICVLPSSTFTPAASSTEGKALNNSLPRCLKSSKAPDDPLATSDGSMQVLRYFSIYDHAYSNGVVVPYHFAPVHCVHEVFEELTAETVEMLVSLLADFVDIAPLPPPLQSKVSDDTVQLRLVPWPSFWKYSVLVNWSTILPFVVVHPTTDVQVGVFSQMNDQFKVPWPPPDETWTCGLRIQDRVWYFLPKYVIALWHIEMFLWIYEQFSYLFLTSIIVNQQLILWDPGGDSGSGTNIISSIQQDSVQFCISFTLINSRFISLVVSWKPLWPLQPRQDICVELRPIPWPSFRSFREVTAGWCFYSLLLLPTNLPSAWWHSGYQSEVLVSSNPSYFRWRFYSYDADLTRSMTEDRLLETLQVMEFTTEQILHSLMDGNILAASAISALGSQEHTITLITRAHKGSDLKYVYSYIPNVFGNPTIVIFWSSTGATTIRLTFTPEESMEGTMTVISPLPPPVEIKLWTSIKNLQAPWDPGGMEIRHRLGGKPIFKKGGC